MIFRVSTIIAVCYAYAYVYSKSYLRMTDKTTHIRHSIWHRRTRRRNIFSSFQRSFLPCHTSILKLDILHWFVGDYNDHMTSSILKLDILPSLATVCGGYEWPHHFCNFIQELKSNILACWRGADYNDPININVGNYIMFRSLPNNSGLLAWRRL